MRQEYLKHCNFEVVVTVFHLIFSVLLLPKLQSSTFYTNACILYAYEIIFDRWHGGLYCVFVVLILYVFCQSNNFLSIGPYDAFPDSLPLLTVLAISVKPIINHWFSSASFILVSLVIIMLHSGKHVLEMLFTMTLCLVLRAEQSRLQLSDFEITFVISVAQVLLIFPVPDYQTNRIHSKQTTGDVLNVVQEGIKQILLFGFFLVTLSAISRWPQLHIQSLHPVMYLLAGGSWALLAILPALGRVLGENALIWLCRVLVTDSALGLRVVLLWAFELAIFLPSIASVSRRWSLSRVWSRKLFHLLAVLMFAPIAILAQIQLSQACYKPENELAGCSSAALDILSLGLGVATCALLLLEFLRYGMRNSDKSRKPVLLASIESYFDQFTDKRDSRALVLTHIYLLLGCSFSVWMAHGMVAARWEADGVRGVEEGTGLDARVLFQKYPLLMHLGWISVGVGDAAAAMWGTVFGRTHWIGSRRTVEGSLVGLVAMVAATGIVYAWTLPLGLSASQTLFNEIFASSSALVICCITEALTSEIDNIVVPLQTLAMYLLLHKFNA